MKRFYLKLLNILFDSNYFCGDYRFNFCRHEILANCFYARGRSRLVLTSFQLPSDATAERTTKIVKDFEGHLNEQSDVKSNISIMGWGFSGAGQNVALAFTTLKDFGERDKSTTDYTNFINAEMANSKEGTTMSVLPPAIDELGTSSGFSLRLQDKANLGMPALISAQEKLMEMAAQNKSFIWFTQKVYLKVTILA